MTAITVTDLTTGVVDGSGVFDGLMKATNAHIQVEYQKNRIKGSEYATVYLGAMQSVMSQSLQLLLTQQKVDLEAQLLAKQLESENLRQAQLTEQTSNLVTERDQITAQTALIEQQEDNLLSESLNIPKQGQLLDAQVAVQVQQELNLQAAKLQTEAQTSLIEQQTANAIIEGTVLTAQECKLSAEFDLINEQKLKTIAETALLSQKKVTEQAQTSGAVINEDSVVGKQIVLYDAQKDGYRRDAEQKAAKLMVDTWNVRKTMDSTTKAGDGTGNNLGDEKVGEAISMLLDGIRQTPPE